MALGAKNISISSQYKGNEYSGVYSVSGTTLITRIPGLGSKSIESSDEDAAANAQQLMQQILEQADQLGRI